MFFYQFSYADKVTNCDIVVYGLIHAGKEIAFPNCCKCFEHHDRHRKDKNHNMRGGHLDDTDRVKLIGEQSVLPLADI